MNQEKLEFWNNRAKDKPDHAGTDDFMLKNLETQAIMDSISDGARVLDLGCGSGVTIIKLANEKNCECVGLDFSAQMLEIAKQKAVEANVLDKITLIQSGLLELPTNIGKFDYVITQRSLINLDALEQQHSVFKNIASYLNSNGKYLMIESFNDGLAKINELRTLLGLYLMEKPWHNLFLNEADILQWQTDRFKIEDFNRFASTYYLFSRVLYAKLAEINDEQLKYDSDINKIACLLPAIGDIGYVQMVKWIKN